MLAALGAAAVGGTLVFNTGDPSPVAITSSVLPGGTLPAGAPLPAGTAVVAKTARLSRGQATVSLPCPAGERVADLLPPGNPDVTAGYAPGTNPGASTAARVMLLGAHPGDQQVAVAVAILCRRPQGDGALVPFAGAVSARTSQLATTCVAHAFLRDRPHGHPVGSVSLAQPLLTLTRDRTWEQVRTQFHATGWLPQSTVCDGALPRSAGPRGAT